MKKHIVFIVIATLLLPHKIFSQSIISVNTETQPSTFFDSIYGANPNLVNGIGNKVNYYRADGHPFLYSKDYSKGSISIKNTNFNNCLLNYNIYNQCIYLMYSNQFGSTNTVELSNAWIDGFSIGENNFKILSFDDYQNRIFEEIGDGEHKILYFWSKEYKLNTLQASLPYFFTDPMRESFVKVDGKIHKYKNNRTFVKAFDPDLQINIKTYLRQHKINVAHASNESLRHLINYCNNLISK